MKIGIDSYCYHRFFGEVYPGQIKPKKNMTMSDFLERAKQLDVDGVSLETCFLSSFENSYMLELKSQIDEYDFDRVLAWGHPNGLERGHNAAAFKEMLSFIPKAKLIGAEVMRITGSCFDYRREPHGPQIKALIPLLKEAVRVAKQNDIKLAIENHVDFTADEVLQIIDEVGSDYMGVNFDTGNFLRLLDDPIRGMQILAPYVLSTHIKDMVINPDFDPTNHLFFSCVPVGQGVVDNLKLAQILNKTNYRGFLAVELDQPAKQWEELEDAAVAVSVHNLRKIADSLKQ